jgi:hypothetical protein
LAEIVNPVIKGRNLGHWEFLSEHFERTFE